MLVMQALKSNVSVLFYPMTLNRMALVIRVIVYTHNEPILNIIIKLIRFRIPMLRVFNSEIGRTKMTTSSTMLRAAPAKPTAVKSTHCPWMVRSQMDDMGEHWNKITIINAAPWLHMKPIKILVAILNQGRGKTRKYRRRIAILARSWTRMYNTWTT